MTLEQIWAKYHLEYELSNKRFEFLYMMNDVIEFYLGKECFEIDIDRNKNIKDIYRVVNYSPVESNLEELLKVLESQLEEG